ncbi:MAG: hypothetical protein ABSB94_08575 [Syntrophorhabdales bacterium]
MYDQGMDTAQPHERGRAPPGTHPTGREGRVHDPEHAVVRPPKEESYVREGLVERPHRTRHRSRSPHAANSGRGEANRGPATKNAS